MTAKRTVEAITAALTTPEDDVRRVDVNPPQGWRPPAIDVRRTLIHEWALTTEQAAAIGDRVYAGTCGLEIETAYFGRQPLTSERIKAELLSAATRPSLPDGESDAEIGQRAPYGMRRGT